MDQQVKLHGLHMSPYSWRVVWALKMKGIPYDYVEEDLSNKSTLLLQYNPVYKKIPVLVHGGKPICESLVILQYIEEAWPNSPLLPSDPLQRSIARFWLKFADEKIPRLWKIALSSGEEREKAIKESVEILETIEEHMMSDGKKFYGGDKIGMVDLAYGAIAHWFALIELNLGLTILEPHKFPRLLQWIKNFKDDPIINENLPVIEKKE